jgi:hypothetical protein
MDRLSIVVNMRGRLAGFQKSALNLRPDPVHPLNEDMDIIHARLKISEAYVAELRK